MQNFHFEVFIVVNVIHLQFKLYISDKASFSFGDKIKSVVRAFFHIYNIDSFPTNRPSFKMSEGRRIREKIETQF